MTDTSALSVSDTQWQTMLETVKGLGEHNASWEHILAQAGPVFLGSLLGIGSALFLDWLRTRRENRNALTNRREKDAADLLDRQTRELAQLNLVSTAMGFNLENLQHVAMQQVLPHFYHSREALEELNSYTVAEQFMRFGTKMGTEFPCMITRCPEIYFFEVEFFKEIPFVLENDPEILKLSGWMTSFMGQLKSNLSDRNARIDSAGGAAVGHSTISELIGYVKVQAAISNAEVVHTLQLIQQITKICDKLRKVVEQYKHIRGAHLRVAAPESLSDTIAELTRISRINYPDFPPPESATE